MEGVHVPHNVRIEWDLSVMTTLWCIWNEKNRRIFLWNSLALLSSVASHIFWLRNILKKKWIKFVHGSGPRGVDGSIAIQAGSRRG